MPLPEFAELQTKRLLIRPVESSDLAALMAVNGDAEVTRYLPYDTWAQAEDASTWFARMQGLRQAGSGQQMVIVRREDAQLIGTLLLFAFDAASARLELGYVLGRAHWRCGYAREALHAVCSQAFGALGLRRLEAQVQPANIASNRLLQDLGFVLEGTLRQRWVAKGQAYDVNFYGCLAAQWRSSPASAG